MEEEKLKMAIIAGASCAMDYKEENPFSSSEETIRYVSEKASEILSKIDIG
ncbi:MAG: hypothetical protein AABW65_03605 [Nanoarchaeota archaeon]